MEKDTKEAIPLTFADLEIRVLKRGDAGYSVEITLNPGQYYRRGVLSPDLPTMGDGAQMGVRLFRWLFTDPMLKGAWEHVRGQQSQRRIRLRLDADVPELHALPWEALRDPETGVDLAAANATPFSRFLAGPWLPGSPIPTRPIRILVAIASPDDLGRYNLAALDAEAEWAALCDATQGLDIALTRLPQPCTLTAIERELRQRADARYHALHIVAHGVYSERRRHAALYLADAENRVQVVRADAFAAMLKRQLTDNNAQDPDRLRLVFLASCESAKRDTANAFRGLAPALVDAGVPAVVAMQDTVSIVTARAFSRTFYERLLQHGIVDLAINQARAALLTAGSREAATPVLLMRLEDGQLWRETAEARVLPDAIAAHRAALRERLAREAQTRWGGMSLYIQEEGAILPIEASPYQLGRLGPRANLMRTLHAAERLLVLGEPGAGKTVALERLAWELCDDEQPVIPVLVSLRFYDGKPLLEWVQSALQQTGHLRFDDTELVAFLQEGPAHCVFLLDGLNEVPPAYRDTLVGALVRWMDAYPKHALVLTSRVQDAGWRLLRDRMAQAVVVQPISDAQARAYLEAHLQDQGAALYARLDECLRSLARRPLLLWLIKEAGAADDEAVPGNRGELYTRFVARMLRRDTDRRMDAEIPEAQKRQALADLAYHLGQGQRLTCPREEAVTVVAARFGEAEARTLVGACARHGLLAGEAVLWFAPHQTVQEHFAALALRARWQQECQAPVWRRWWCALRQAHVVALAADDWWAETFVQLAGMVGDGAEAGADRLAQDLAKVNPWLAWWCVEEGHRVRAATRDVVEARSMKLLRSERVQDRRRAVEALAQMQNERVIAPLFEAAGDADEEVAQRAVGALTAFGEAVRPLALSALRGKDLRLQCAALRCASAQPTDVIPSVFWQRTLDFAMCYVSSGPFLMGSDKDKDSMAWDNELPQHEVTLPGYWIAKTPVTVAQFWAFVRASDYVWESRDRKQGGDDHPVVWVSWRDARAYCQWVSQRTGLHVTLPTEAEWEKAARGPALSGAEGPGQIYPWGDEWDAGKCNSREGGEGSTTSVGRYSPEGDSYYGCVDMAGNVWEWTSSSFKPYPYRVDDGREDMDADRDRVVRGGSFRSYRDLARCSYRSGYGPNLVHVNFGFRVVVSPSRSGL